MSLGLTASTIKVLRLDAQNPAYTEATREQCAKAAGQLERGEISEDAASNVSFYAGLALVAAYQRGTAFADDLPAAVREARKTYLFAQVDSVIARLRTLGGGDTMIGLLEGAIATGDLNRLGSLWPRANGVAPRAEIAARIEERIRNAR